MPTHPSEDGYTLDGIDPPGFERFPTDVRLMFYTWVVEIGLRQKDRDLAKGLNKDGKRLKPITKYTREHRKSAMTSSGKGDPEAPPLIPGWQKSRVRSLLTGKAFPNRAEFWWKYDAFIGDSFARILEHQAEVGRDVFGLSPAAEKRTKAQAWERWDKWRKGKPAEPPPRMVKPAEPPPLGPRRVEDWIKYFRQTAPAALPGRPLQPRVVSPIAGGQYNRLLQHIYGMPAQKPPPSYHPPVPIVPRPLAPRPLIQKISIPQRILAIPRRIVGRIIDWLKSA